MKKTYKIIAILIITLFIGVIFSDSVLADTYKNYDKTGFVSCGSGYVKNIPKALPKVTSVVYIVIQIVVPILLIIFGMIDLVKAITSQKDDEIKKGTQMFVKRLIAGALVFFVFVIVKFFISLVADSKGDHGINKIMGCAECFIENNKKCVSGKL